MKEDIISGLGLRARVAFDDVGGEGAAERAEPRPLFKHKKLKKIEEKSVVCLNSESMRGK